MLLMNEGLIAEAYALFLYSFVCKWICPSAWVFSLQHFMLYECQERLAFSHPILQFAPCSYYVYMHIFLYFAFAD